MTKTDFQVRTSPLEVSLLNSLQAQNFTNKNNLTFMKSVEEKVSMKKRYRNERQKNLVNSNPLSFKRFNNFAECSRFHQVGG